MDVLPPYVINEVSRRNSKKHTLHFILFKKIFLLCSKEMESLLGRPASNSWAQGIRPPHPPELRKQQACVSRPGSIPPQDGCLQGCSCLFFFFFCDLWSTQGSVVRKMLQFLPWNRNGFPFFSNHNQTTSHCIYGHINQEHWVRQKINACGLPLNVEFDG